jgi:hypothetical protein
MCEDQRELDREEDRIASRSKKLKKSDLPDDQFIAYPRPLTYLNNFQNGARECSERAPSPQKQGRREIRSEAELHFRSDWGGLHGAGMDRLPTNQVGLQSSRCYWSGDAAGGVLAPPRTRGFQERTYSMRISLVETLGALSQAGLSVSQGRVDLDLERTGRNGVRRGSGALGDLGRNPVTRCYRDSCPGF